MSSHKTIGQGVYRDVYNLGYGYVLKVAKSKYGRMCNKKEVMIYQSSPSSLRNHLGKIVDFQKDFSWIIMKRYNHKFPQSSTYRSKLSNVNSLFRRRGIYPYDVFNRFGEPNIKNLRLKRNGEICYIDYGNFRFR
ncbi:UNVERIFIED_CONTAM: hypothetical protein ABID98_004110 [Brevibacillus sp. OAP136]